MSCLRALIFFFLVSEGMGAEIPSPFAADPAQAQERTCFQTGSPWSGDADLRSDVAICYGIGAGVGDRVQTWREHGYRVHLMTGVAWGHYEDYLDGRFDGTKHEDEEQTDRAGHPHRHDRTGQVFYMCPGTNYGQYRCVGVQRALDAGVEAVHLEEPEFWVQDGYSEGFKREWKNYYHEDWQPPHSSADAQWRASKLKYFLYRRALQQVFDYVQDYNHRSGRHVRCYVPTHSLLNYAQWHIVSPESSLARLNGCDGYIAQVWTGTSRTPNMYRGQLRERTFDTAFLEYGAMQNLVRSTGRSVWYLNDPIEDNPAHDWNDYQHNWECTLTASLFQPEVWRYEVAPWPERIFRGHYPHGSADAKPIPAGYATELQVVMNALNDMNQSDVQWDCGSTGVGVLVSDSLMFERGDPAPSDPHLGHIYGLALPLLKRGCPVTPVQLENLEVPHYLDGFKILLLTYQGMKPLTPEVHGALAAWVKAGGALVVVDDDSDPFNQVREWWNSSGQHFAGPREHLFQELGFAETAAPSGGPLPATRVGSGTLVWLRKNPAKLTAEPDGDAQVIQATEEAARSIRFPWKETNYLLLRRGPYVVASGLDESSTAEPKKIIGRFVNLFDPALAVLRNPNLPPGTRFLLRDLDASANGGTAVLAAGCKTLVQTNVADSCSMWVEGVANTQATVLMRAKTAPTSILCGGEPLKTFEFDAAENLLWLHFPNASTPRELILKFSAKGS